MTLQITLHIYSGKPDPTWTIDGVDEQRVREMLASPPPTIRPMTPYVLGYRGFSVIDPAAPNQPVGPPYSGEGFTGVPEIEEFLWLNGLSTPLTIDEFGPTPGSVPPFPGHLTTDALESRPIARAVTCPPSLAADAPAWDPDYWGPPHQATYRCYNYAVNYRAGTGHAWPGNASRNNTGYFTVASMYGGAISDGLIPQQDFNTARGPGEGHYCALVVHPGRDHHWYRQDNNGCWSHKMSTQFPRNVDSFGQLIADPRYCQRGPYTLFVSFFLVPPGTVISGWG